MYIAPHLMQSQYHSQNQPSREQVILPLPTPPIINLPQCNQVMGISQMRNLWLEQCNSRRRPHSQMFTNMNLASTILKPSHTKTKHSI